MDASVKLPESGHSLNWHRVCPARRARHAVTQTKQLPANAGAVQSEMLSRLVMFQRAFAMQERTFRLSRQRRRAQRVQNVSLDVQVVRDVQLAPRTGKDPAHAAVLLSWFLAGLAALAL